MCSAPVTVLHPLVIAMVAVHAPFSLSCTAPYSIILWHAGRPSEGATLFIHHNGGTLHHFFASLGSTRPFVGNTLARITVWWVATPLLTSFLAVHWQLHKRVTFWERIASLRYDISRLAFSDMPRYSKQPTPCYLPRSWSFHIGTCVAHISMC